MDTPRSELAPPERFELGAPLGRGAVGMVHRAWDRVLGREVAVKLLLVDKPSAVQMERFRREGELARAIDHPHVVRLLAAGTCQGRPCLAFELVEQARTLRQALPDLEPRRVVELLRDAARALGAAHRVAVVHRDVKLDNLLLDGQSQVKVTDFGVATAAHLARLTRSGAIVGTPQALAPEQVSGGAVSPATDVWALGVALHEALLGEPPFGGEDMLQLLQRIVDAPLPPLARRGVDAGLAAIVERCLEKEPARRYPDGDAVAAALDAWLSGEPSQGRRWRVSPLLLSPLLLLVGLVAAGLVVARERAARHAASCAALESAVWAALGSGSSVAAAGSRLSAREAELRELEARGVLPPLQRARHGLGVTRALTALAAGDAGPARSLAEGLEDECGSALRGGLAALEPTGDPEAAWAALTRAIEGGLGADELRLWRARAALRLPEPGPERLATALADLRDLAPRLDRSGRLLRAELALRAGDLDLTRSCLETVEDAPPAVGWKLVLAEAWRGDPLLDQPSQLADRLEALGAADRPDTPAVRLLLQGVEARFRDTTQQAARVGEERLLSVAQRARLVALARVNQALGGGLSERGVLDLWDGPLENHSQALLAHLLLLQRARELSPPEAVEALWAPCVQLLAYRALSAGGGAGLEEMVELVPEPWLQARVRFFRGVDRRRHQRWREAYEDLRQVESWLDDPRLLALWEHPSFRGAARAELRFNQALIMEGLGSRQEAVRLGLEALETSPLGIHMAGGVDLFNADLAMDVVWRCAFPHQPAQARAALETRLAGGVGRPHNWVRLARLELLAGDPLRAESRLSPVQAFAEARGQRVQEALLAAHRALQVEGAPEGDARLRELEALLQE